MEGEVHKVPQFMPSVQKLTKQFGRIFASDAPKVWSNDIRSVKTLLSFWKKLKAYLFTNTYLH